MIALGQVPNPITGKTELRLKQAKHYVRTVIIPGAPHFWVSEPLDEPGSYNGLQALHLIGGLDTLTDTERDSLAGWFLQSRRPDGVFRIEGMKPEFIQHKRGIEEFVESLSENKEKVIPKPIVLKGQKDKIIAEIVLAVGTLGFFIAVGILAVLAVVTLRHDAGADLRGSRRRAEWHRGESVHRQLAHSWG